MDPPSFKTDIGIFDSEPSISELFVSAKKFLNLQPRINNRALRKSSSHSQMNHTMIQSNHKDLISPQLIDSTTSDNQILNLLSPLSMDDLKNNVTTNSTTTTNSTKYKNESLNTPKSEMSSPNIQKSTETKHLTSNLTSSLSQLKDKQTEKPSTECHNCKTHKTPLWRKDAEGNTLCNACGLFLKLHGTTRPLSLKTDVIKKRNSKKVTNPKTSNQFINTGVKFDQNLKSKTINIAPSSSAPQSSASASASQRYKNILILPKPSSVTTKSIPIPSSNSVSSSPQPFSPFSTSASSYTINSNQPFKRKKSEINLEDAAGTPFSNRSRQPSTTSLASSIPNSIQRKNSYINNNNRRGSTRKSVVNLSSTPTNSSSLTSQNINILNQRFPQSSYFEQPNISRHNSATQVNQKESPNSYNSASSSFNNYNENEDASTSVPATPFNVCGLLPSSSRQKVLEEYRASKPPIIQYQGIDDEMLIGSNNDFFKNYTSLQNDMIEEFIEVPETNFKNDYKELDWLKFDI